MNEEELIKFLNSDKQYITISKNETGTKKDWLTKLPYNDKVTLLYVLEERSHYDILKEYTYGSGLRLAGVYDKEQQKIYHSSFALYRVLGLDLNDTSKILEEDSLLFKKFNKEVCSLINETVSTKAQDFKEKVDLQNYNPRIDEEEIFRKFLDNNFPVEYDCKFDIRYENSTSIIDLISDYDKKVVETATNYITSNAELIGKDLIYNDILNQKLKELQNDKNNDLYKARDIYKSCNDDSIGMVHVFINKDNKNFDFKYPASILSSIYVIDSYLSTYRMPSQDRLKFEELYGRSGDFNFKDITKIEYRNKPLYIDNSYSNEKVDDEKLNKKEQEIKEWAYMDWENGTLLSPDDFDEFKDMMRDMGYKATEKDFDKYFEYYDEAREQDLGDTDENDYADEEDQDLEI